MCNVCCKEFKGWCRSFTRTEVALAALEMALLVIFIAFLTFLILHLLACAGGDEFDDILVTKPTTVQITAITSINVTPTQTTTAHTTLDPMVECTWKPSEKTEASVRYYENGQTKTAILKHEPTPNASTASQKIEIDDQADGTIADETKRGFLLALVKMKMPNDVIFGCVLTIISQHCALTAASCVESIEEVDAVDSFVMIEGYGDRRAGRTHAVSDVLIHPEYLGTEKNFDVAVLKSEDTLIKTGQPLVTLPKMLDALLVTIGEPFSLLGYGRFRRVEGETMRAVHEVRVRALPSVQCARTWAPRHLSRGVALKPAACALPPLCAGTLGGGAASDSAPCGYCAGTPLLRGRMLLGTMSFVPCGDPCEPAFYVNLAVVADWLQSVLSEQ
ncbi:venom plasminogen activator GPV-PA-like [Battus philenor]|uniref:venom plasminogen activator GPV-PA-like n=1 Tax=Battus philenor TaxID=42288 RepID=UPI0035CF9B25